MKIFKWFYWFTKYNTLKLKRNCERRAYSKSIQKIGEQLTDLESEVEYWKSRADLRLETNRKLRARIKEMEK